MNIQETLDQEGIGWNSQETLERRDWMVFPGDLRTKGLVGLPRDPQMKGLVGLPSDPRTKGLGLLPRDPRTKGLDDLWETHGRRDCGSKRPMHKGTGFDFYRPGDPRTKGLDELPRDPRTKGPEMNHPSEPQIEGDASKLR